MFHSNNGGTNPAIGRSISSVESAQKLLVFAGGADGKFNAEPDCGEAVDRLIQFIETFERGAIKCEV